MTDQHTQKNLALWDEVQGTDPRYTKEYSGTGGFSGTAINATYLVRRATETFGPIGIGWGYEILEERYDSGGPLTVTEDGHEIRAMVHTIKLRLWYKNGPDLGEVVHFGHTPYVYSNKYGIQTDMEAPKKSLTDAIKKSLSMIGFAADVFMGEFDDIHYVEHARQQHDLERAEDKIETKERQAREYKEWLARNLDQIQNAVNMTMLEEVYKSAMRKVKLRNDADAMKDLTHAKEKRKAALEKGGA